MHPIVTIALDEETLTEIERIRCGSWMDAETFAAYRAGPLFTVNVERLREALEAVQREAGPPPPRPTGTEQEDLEWAKSQLGRRVH